MKVLHILMLGVFTLYFVSCKKDVTGSGTVITQLRQVNDFKSIESGGDFQVTFTKASTCKVEVTGEDNVIEHVITRVTGNKLVIEYENGFRIHQHKQITVSISMPDLENIELNGSGRISSDTIWLMPNCKVTLNGSGTISLRINIDVLKAAISGSGDLELSGQSLTSDFTIGGSGSIRAFSLQSQSATVNISGSGKTETSVVAKLVVSIKGSGNTYYKGNPSVTSTINGSGKVIKS